jgi:hypothetical protein
MEMKDNIKLAVKEMGCLDVQWMKYTQDRIQWLVFVFIYIVQT